MATAATISAKLILDSSGYDKGIDSESKKTDSFSKTLSSKLSDVGGKMAMVGGVMSAAVTAPIVAGFKSAIEASSDLSESANAMNVVFGDAALTMEKFGETSATTVGLSTSDFNQLSATTGAFLKNVGFDLQGAADETINLTSRASDMASIFNTDVSQALGAIQSGLKGEFNPLEQFGVKINAAAIEAKALSMGLAETKGELDDNAKAQAALALIYEQTDQFAGDFKNTSDGLANSTRIMNAEITNASAELGEEFQPILLDLIKTGREVIKWFSDLSPEMKKTIGVIALVVAVVGPLILIIGTIISAIGAIIPVVTAVAGVLTMPLMAIIVLVIGIITLLWMAWTQNWGDIQGKTKAVVEWIIVFIDRLVKWVKDIPENTAKTFEKIKSDFENLKTRIGEKIYETIENIKKFFTETDWGELGLNIIKGIASGIKNAASFLKDAAVSAAKAAYDAAAGFLGIHSKSKLFESLGEYSMLGLAEGISNLSNVPTDMTLQASEGIASSVIPKPKPAPTSGGMDNTMLAQIKYLLENQPESIARAVRSATAKAR
jgi:hypothetical protein